MGKTVKCDIAVYHIILAPWPRGLEAFLLGRPRYLWMLQSQSEMVSEIKNK